MKLTVAQALVRFLAVQEIERDGERRRFFAGCFGIFGHGNVAGLGQALHQHQDRCPTTRPATSRRWCTRVRLRAPEQPARRRYACTTSVGPGATNMVTGAALATINRLPVLLLPGDTFATRRRTRAAAARGSARRDAVGQRLLQAGVALLRRGSCGRSSSCPPRSRRCACSPIPPRPARSRWPCPRTSRPRRSTVPDAFLEPRTWTVFRQPTAPDALARAAELIRAARRPLIVAGGGVIYAEATDALRRAGRRHRDPGRRDAGGPRRAGV